MSLMRGTRRALLSRSWSLPFLIPLITGSPSIGTPTLAVA
jgi:hypothetical protein